MATVYGVNRTIFNDPTQANAIDGSKSKAGVHYMYDEYTAASLAANDVIQVGDVLPAGAIVIDVQLDFADLGTGNTMHAGDSADVDRYLVSVDTATAAGKASMRISSATISPATGVGYVVGTVSGDDQIQLTNLGASATGLIKVAIIYAIRG